MNHVSLLTKSVMGFGFLGCALCSAAEVEAKSNYVQISEGAATNTLRALAEQTGLQILFQPTSVEGKATRAVSGYVNGQEALQQMLDGSGLLATPINDTTVAISLRKPASLWQRPLHSEASDSSEVTPDSSGADDSAARNRGAAKEQSLAEILVQGKRSLNVDIQRSEDDVQPYVVLNNEEIRRSNVSNVEQLLQQKLGGALSLQPTAQLGGSLLGTASRVDLRGLGTDETLILINGRRTASLSLSGNAFQPDLNGIPLASIERIEVLASTASGIFGGGATGGVINVILKQDYQGINVSAVYGNTFNSSSYTRKIDVSGGTSFEGGKTSVTLNASYADDEGLTAGQRDFVRDSRELILKNNPAAIYQSPLPPSGQTTNIRSTTGVLQLKPQYGGAVLPANFTYLPAGYSGVAADNGAALVSNAGTYALGFPNTAQVSGTRSLLLKSPTVRSLSASIHRRFSDRVEAFIEGGATKSDSSLVQSVTSGQVQLAANSVANPFVQPVFLQIPIPGMDGVTETVLQSRRAVAGVIFSLSDNWHLEAEYSWNTSELETTQVQGLSNTAFTTGAIDPFRDLNVYAADFSGFTLPGNYMTPAKTTVSNPSMRVGGILPISLFGGNKPSFTAAIEYRREELDDAYLIQPTIQSYYPARQQSVVSAYAETRLPLVTKQNSLPGINMFEVQVAVRRDEYETTAGNIVNLPIQSISAATAVTQDAHSTDPTIGIRYEPVPGVMLRGSYATGFLPPNMSQLVPAVPVPSFVAPTLGLTDPLRGNASVSGTLTSYGGGNPDLTPEQAKSWTVGLVFQPEFIQDLRVAVDRTRIQKRDNIASLQLNQQLLNSSVFVPSLVTRDAATPQNDPTGFGVGPITGFSTAQLNFAKLDVTAYDLSASYIWKTTRLGDLSFASRATRMMENTSQIAPTSTPIVNVGNPGYPKWNASADFIWYRREWSAGWSTRYFDKYWLDTTHLFNLSQGSAVVPSQIYHDLFIAYTNRGTSKGVGIANGLLSDVTVQFGVKNVFNKSPPILVNTTSGYSYIGDPRMARYILTVQKEF